MAIEKVEYDLLLRDFLSGKIKDAETSVNSFESQVQKLNGTIGKIGAAIGISFGVGAIKSFIGSVVEAGSKVEDARTGLTTLLGDTAKASQVVQNTLKDAQKTPFAFEGLLSANQQLIASGVNADRAREDVMNLANAVAASGKGNAEFERMTQNLAQIKTVGKASAMDIKQFGIAGINIYQVLANATGKSVAQVKDMEVSYDTLTAALKKAHEAGGMFAGGLEKMSANTSVKISNLGDTIFVTMVDIFDKMKPLTDFVLGGVAKGLTFIQEGISKLDLAGFANKLISIFKNLMDYIKPVWDALVGGFQRLYAAGMKVWATLSQFGGEGQSILLKLREVVIWLYNAFISWYEFLYGVIAAIIDVAHTVYVILEKLGVISFIGALFEKVWGVIKWIGSGLKTIYENTLKPIFEKIEWAYNKLKALLGIKEVKVTGDTKNLMEQSKEKTADQTTTDTNKLLKEVGGSTIPTKSDAAKVTGSKSTTINIQIGKLIEQFKVQTTNMQEGSSKVRELVAQALLSAVNDSQITAGI